MTEQSQVLRLSANERAVLEKFHARCVVNNVKEFSSDTFRMWGFDKQLYGDKDHKTGIYFFKLKWLGLIEQVRVECSTMLSRHGGKIGVWRWKK